MEYEKIDDFNWMTYQRDTWTSQFGARVMFSILQKNVVIQN